MGFARSVFDNRNGRNGWSAFAAIELALWDIAGRHCGAPLADMIGGRARRDHVAVYVVADFRQLGEPVPDHEIIAHGFFGLDELPNDTTGPTRARIIEVLGGAPMTEQW